LTVKQLDYSKPFIVLNFKTYKEASGEYALRLAKAAENVQRKTGLNFIVASQAIDLKEIAAAVRIPVYAQHTDYAAIGKSTGNIIAENLMDINVHGTLLNHSEKRLDARIIQKTVLRMKEIDLKTIVCVANNTEAKKYSAIKPVRPDFIAIEPPELIGGETSVSSAKPDIIEKAVKACAGVNVLVGAGIKDNNDLKVALSYGAKGVLLASHFVMSKDPEKFLMDLIRGV
jgi:triosephosphate isomerase